MNNGLRATIGIEIHTELLTQSKMFSGAPNTFGETPNTMITAIDLAYPGTMPTINRKAVELGITLALALKMEIDSVLQFDRKHYFYPDLPKGYQITQQHHPLGRDGKLVMTNKSIAIERAHLEEDTAKTINEGGTLLVDYNRAGIPLLEIVSAPELHSAAEAMEYVATMRAILSFAKISDARMENGSMRCDVNISVAPWGAPLGTKVEIKNINSIANVGKAIEFEIKRQSRMVLLNQSVSQETRRWDDGAKATILMRKKSDAVDYRYLAEPNLAPIVIDKGFIGDIAATMPILPAQLRVILGKEGLKAQEIDHIVSDFDLYRAFRAVADRSNNPKESFTWVANDVVGSLARNARRLGDVKQEKFALIGAMLEMINNGDLNGKQGKTLLEQILSNELTTIEEYVEAAGMRQVKDPKLLTAIIERIIESNRDTIQEWHDRPERGERFILGLLMKETNGQANPVLSSEIVKQALKKSLTKE